MSDISQAYTRLGVSSEASHQEIEAAYHRQRIAFESDPGSDPWDFQDIQEAYALVREHRSSPKQSAPRGQQSCKATPANQTKPSNATREVHEREATQQPSHQQPATKEANNLPTHLLWQAFFKKLPLQNETTVFILANVLDIIMTYGLLRFGGIETNPIANYFMQRWGFDGMIFLKMCSVAFVAVLSQVIAVRDEAKARRLLILGSVIVFAVVIYSAILLSRLLR